MDIWKVVVVTEREPNDLYDLYDEDVTVETEIFINETKARAYYETQDWKDLDCPDEFTVTMYKAAYEDDRGIILWAHVDGRDIKKEDEDEDEE